RSVDGGATWTPLADTASQSTAVNRIAIAPSGGVLLAATNTGLWRSADNGASFALATTGITPQDVDFSPADALKAVAGGYGAIVFSWDGGATWQSARGLPTTSGRIELAYARSQPDTIYALVDTGGGADRLHRARQQSRRDAVLRRRRQRHDRRHRRRHAGQRDARPPAAVRHVVEEHARRRWRLRRGRSDRRVVLLRGDDLPASVSQRRRGGDGD